MSERLDRIERLLELHSEQLQQQSQQFQGRMDALAERMDRLAERQDRFQAELEQSRREADERMTRIETELDENFEYIGTEIGRLTRGLAALTQVVEQDRNQAAIDRAEFRSTVDRLLEVLTERFTRNGHDNE